MTVNIGAGGNAAIESAAALTNALLRLSNTKGSLEHVKIALQEYQTQRKYRVNKICDASSAVSRRESLQHPLDRSGFFYILPYLRTFFAYRTCKILIDSELVDSLPPPQRAFQGTMPHDSAPGMGKGESKLWRALYALPLLGFVVVAHNTMGAALAAMPVSDVLEGAVILDKGLKIPLCMKYTGWKPVDGVLGFFAAVFSSSIGDYDPAGRLQTIVFVGGDFPALQTIFAIESARRGNYLTAAYFL